MTDRKKRPQVAVLCDRPDFERYQEVARRRKTTLSAVVRELLDAECLRLDELDARKAKLERMRPPEPHEPAQTDIEDAIEKKAGKQGKLPSEKRAIGA